MGVYCIIYQNKSVILQKRKDYVKARQKSDRATEQ